MILTTGEPDALVVPEAYKAQLPNISVKPDVPPESFTGLQLSNAMLLCHGASEDGPGESFFIDQSLKFPLEFRGMYHLTPSNLPTISFLIVKLVEATAPPLQETHSPRSSPVQVPSFVYKWALLQNVFWGRKHDTEIVGL